jgi:hypothetical protein
VGGLAGDVAAHEVAPHVVADAHHRSPSHRSQIFAGFDVDVCVRQLGDDVGEHVQVHDRRRAGLLEETLVLGGETVERAAREAALRRRDGDAAEPAMSSCRGEFEGHWRTLLYSQERL